MQTFCNAVDMNLSTNRCLTDSRSEAIAIPLQWAEDTKRNLLDNGEQPCAFQHTAQPQSHCAEHTSALDPVRPLILSQLYFQLAFFLLFFGQYEIWGVQ